PRAELGGHVVAVAMALDGVGQATLAAPGVDLHDLSAIAGDQAADPLGLGRDLFLAEVGIQDKCDLVAMQRLHNNDNTFFLWLHKPGQGKRGGGGGGGPRGGGRRRKPYTKEGQAAVTPTATASIY